MTDAAVATAIRVLVIEDNRSDVLLVGALLSGAPGGGEFETVTARTLAEAEHKLSRDRFDVAIADLSLPDSEGLATVKKLLDTDVNLPIVVLTVTRDDALAIEAVRAGAQDYLIKREVDARTLGRSVRYAIERAALRRALREAQHDVTHLTGMLPVCAACKKIRDDSGYWKQLEAFLEGHTEVTVSHGLCPDCITSLYPDYGAENPA